VEDFKEVGTMLRKFLRFPHEPPAQRLFFEGNLTIQYLNPICKILTMIGLVPPEGKDTPVSVFVSTANSWHRSFDGYLVTTDWNKLGERFDMFRFQFEIQQNGNIIEYVHTKTLLLDMIPFPRFLISAAVEIDHDESDSWHLELSTKLLNHTIVREHGRIRVSNSTYHRRLHNVVLFDGTCVLCDKSVDFVIQRDNRKHRGLPLFKAVAIQSEKGQQFIEDEKMNAAKINKLNTVVLAATDGRVYIESDAALRILLDCNYPWPILGRVGMLVPKFIRDPVYRFIAGHRYRWFGTKEMCGLPKPSDKESYL
jgi:predicted DCC family thiol-disulfide oxidoreductase YuxK